MTTLTPTGARSPRLLSIGLASVLALGSLGLAPAQAATPVSTVHSGSISWGLKASFRSYITGPIADGAITVSAPATDDGTQTTFSGGSGRWRTNDTSASTSGKVNFTGHHGALNLTISNPTIVTTATSTSLVVDAITSDATVLDDLAVATLDLSGAGTLTETDFSVVITDAPATLTAAGAQLFAFNGTPMYPAGTALDSVDATFALVEPTVTATPTTVGDDGSATVQVNGTGFLPRDATASRPPLAGQSGGVYVAVGKFAANWRPSQGGTAPSRKALGSTTKWAVQAANMATIGGAAAGAIELTPEGTFAATLTFSKAQIDAITGLDASHVNYGFYTYTGGGATNSAWEKYIPLTWVPSIATSTSLVVSPTATYGESVTATATLSNPAATGSVTFKAGTVEVKVPVSGGSATANLPGTIPAGSHDVTATYSGDNVYGTSTTQQPLTVSKAASQTTLAVPAASYGRSATVTAGVPGAGTVTLTGAGDPITADVASGTATFTLPSNLLVGDHSLTATYSGDDNHLGSSDTATLTVSKAAVTTTVQVANTVYGTAAKATVTTTGTGTVTLTGVGAARTATVSGGKAVFALPATLAVGRYTLTVSLPATDTALGSTATATLTVAKAAARVTVSAPKTTYGKASKVTVSVPGPGTVTLTGAGTLKANVVNGKATFTLAKTLRVGTYTLKAAYSGSANQNAASATAKLSVAKAKATATVKVTKKPTSKKKGKATVTVKGVSGVTVPGGTVWVKFAKGSSSKTVKASLSKGKRTVTVPKLKKGSWKVTVRYAGDSRYAANGYTKAAGNLKVTK